MRRILILGLALSVFAAGLAPLSACALLSSKMAECAKDTAQSLCDQMHSPNAGIQTFKGSEKSCCVTSQAPLPELQFNSTEVGPLVTIDVSQNMLVIPSARLSSTPAFFECSSPPSSQSLLCTFLI